MSGPFPVAVVVVNWNAGPLLERCLDALEAQTIAPVSAVVVDNASSEGEIELVMRNHPRFRLLRLDWNVGFAAANNVAVRSLSDEIEWVALLNPDAFPSPDWLQRLSEAVAAETRPAFFASRLLSAREAGLMDGTGDLYSASGLAWRRDHGCPAGTESQEGAAVFSACAAAALYPRRAYLEAGGFDEHYFCYFEDVDLAFRLRLAGYQCVYVPAAVVHHVGSAVSGRRSDFAVYHGHRNMVWTYVKNMPGPLLLRYLPQHLAVNAASIAWFSLRGQGRAILRAKWDALRGLRRAWRERRRVQAMRRVPCAVVRRSFARGTLVRLAQSWTRPSALTARTPSD